MVKPQTTRLRESREPVAADARIIDAQFKIVSEGAAARRRSWFRAAMFYLFALAVAAALGFLMPLLWVLMNTLTRP